MDLSFSCGLVRMENMGAGQSGFQEVLNNESQDFLPGLEIRIAELLKQRQLTVTTAESITGGLVANCLTSVPGSSVFYLGGVVSYSVKAKISQLGVSPRLIGQKGVVSAEVAQDMAKGIRERLDADLGISTTGFAGPAVSDTEKVGLVFVGLATRERVTSQQFYFEGSREEIRERTKDAVLGLLYFEVKGM
jgi:PncC family amidohydrolase